MTPITQRAMDAADRYRRFTSALVRQFEVAIRDDPTDARVRDAAIASARSAASDYLAAESEVIAIDTQGFGGDTYADAAAALKLRSTDAPDPMVDHWTTTGEHLRMMLGAQAARDIATLSSEIQTAAMRIDTAKRAGRTTSAAIAASLIDRDHGINFRFVDRIGRRYNAAKHVRDQYRLHLLVSRNEAFLYAAAEAGVDLVQVDHPNPQHQYAGLVVTTGEGSDETPSYYDLADEIFHPSSDAYLSLVE